MTVKFRIGKFDHGTGKVPVIFTGADGNSHARDVVACLNDHGRYDRAATRSRVDQVALGVAHKMRLGKIGTPDPA